MLTKENNEKLNYLCRKAFESLTGQVIVDEKGIVLFISKEHIKYMGIQAEEALGKHVTEVIPGTRMHIVLETGKAEIGNLFHMVHQETKEISSMVCNRIPVYDGDQIVGCMAETVFSKGVDDIHRLSKEVVKHYSKMVIHIEAQDYNISGICGVSKQIRDLKERLYKIANMPLPVLIMGETGTGKEVFANALHDMCMERKDNDIVKINCAAIPGELLESELFGYEAGAFSGANKTGKIGKFEYAKGGTVLLDEIGDMPMLLQTKLLRVLQEKEFERVGGLKPIKFDARIICTTNRNIETLISEGKFREDLYYRINVLELNIPPLRERIEDINDLCNIFIQRMNSEYGLSITGISFAVLDLFKRHYWPGNVRELKGIVDRACMMAGGGAIEIEHLDSFVHRISNYTTKWLLPPRDGVVTLEGAKTVAEIEAIKKALEQTRGNKCKAAKLLGINRTVLYDKIRKYDLEGI